MGEKELPATLAAGRGPTALEVAGRRPAALAPAAAPPRHQPLRSGGFFRFFWVAVFISAQAPRRSDSAVLVGLL